MTRQLWKKQLQDVTMITQLINQPQIFNVTWQGQDHCGNEPVTAYVPESKQEYIDEVSWVS